MLLLRAVLIGLFAIAAAAEFFLFVLGHILMAQAQIYFNDLFIYLAYFGLLDCNIRSCAVKNIHYPL